MGDIHIQVTTSQARSLCLSAVSHKQRTQTKKTKKTKKKKKKKTLGAENGMKEKNVRHFGLTMSGKRPLWSKRKKKTHI